MEENKFDAYEKVLVRDNEYDKWLPTLFGYSDKSDMPYNCLGIWYRYCIPYKGNEYLKGKTDSPKEDLPIDTPVMASENAIYWGNAWYAGNNGVYELSKKVETRKITNGYKYIIPVDKFDFNDPENSLKYNIVK